MVSIALVTRFAPVGLPISPEENGPEGTRASIEAWVESDSFTAVVEASGGPAPGGDLLARLDALDAFTEAKWNFRKGQERNLAEKVEFDPATTDLILDAAEALGLRTGTAPRRQSYDHVLVLGGLAPPLVRVAEGCSMYCSE